MQQGYCLDEANQGVYRVRWWIAKQRLYSTERVLGAQTGCDDKLHKRWEAGSHQGGPLQYRMLELFTLPPHLVFVEVDVYRGPRTSIDDRRVRYLGWRNAARLARNDHVQIGDRNDSRFSYKTNLECLQPGCLEVYCLGGLLSETATDEL